jgi:serine protease
MFGNGEDWNIQGMQCVCRQLLLAGFMGLLLWGCGGGGATEDPGQFGRYTLSGTISAPADVVIDSDVNDPNETYLSNDTFAEAQLISNPVFVAGYVHSASDADDYFKVILNNGDRIMLSLDHEARADLSVSLYDSDRILESTVETSDPAATLNASRTGIYFIHVKAIHGGSNYILAIAPQIGVADDTLSVEADFVPGQAIVRFKALHLSDDRVAALGMAMAAGGAQREHLLCFDTMHGAKAVFGALGIGDDPYRRQAGDGDLLVQKRDTLEVIRALRRLPDVHSAEPNFIVRHYATIPDDTLYPRQWHLPLINLPDAWDITTGSRDIVVAVIDTGVLMAHPDLQGRLTEDGYDFVSDPLMSNDGDGIDPDPNDPGDGDWSHGGSSFHGTHVAGTIAATGNNRIGVAGVGWQTRVMPVRVLGSGGSGTLYDVLQGVRYAAGEPNDSGTLPFRPADIINLSLGTSAYSPATQDLFTQIRNKGIIVIAAAGNENSSAPEYPAGYTGVWAISAVNLDRIRAAYSNYGPHIDLAAPGGDLTPVGDGGAPALVWSTGGDDSSGTTRFTYTAYGGTSMAAPHVSGVVALMKALYPALSPIELDTLLEDGAITNDMGDAGRDDDYGWGLIDAYKAVTAVQALSAALPALKVTPETLYFSADTDSAALTIDAIGNGVIAVTAVLVDVPWLDVAVTNIDADGLGVYTVAVDRTAGDLTEGIHSAAITFSTRPAQAIKVPVHLHVGAAKGHNGGLQYVVLENLDTGAVQIRQIRSESGFYHYAFSGVGQGRYRVFAGSDRDNDGRLDNVGESFGAYPASDRMVTITADSHQYGLDFGSDLHLP